MLKENEMNEQRKAMEEIECWFELPRTAGALPQ